MFQGSWGPLRLRLSTTWRWAVNSWLPVSWLKLCLTTTLPWVRLHRDALADTHVSLSPIAGTHPIFPKILLICSNLTHLIPHRGRLEELPHLLQARSGVPGDGKIQIGPAGSDHGHPAQTWFLGCKFTWSPQVCVHVPIIFQQVLLAALRFPLPFYTIILYSYFQARLQRGNILLKQGSTQDAREDFEAVVSLAPKRCFLSFDNHCFLHVLTHF